MRTVIFNVAVIMLLLSLYACKNSYERDSLERYAPLATLDSEKLCEFFPSDTDYRVPDLETIVAALHRSFSISEGENGFVAQTNGTYLDANIDPYQISRWLYERYFGAYEESAPEFSSGIWNSARIQFTPRSTMEWYSLAAETILKSHYYEQQRLYYGNLACEANGSLGEGANRDKLYEVLVGSGYSSYFVGCCSQTITNPFEIANLFYPSPEVGKSMCISSIDKFQRSQSYACVAAALTEFNPEYDQRNLIRKPAN